MGGGGFTLELRKLISDTMQSNDIEKQIQTQKKIAPRISGPLVDMLQ